MPGRDLKLNSLSRYSKESPHFVLEEHGHCEVPAGCGGVVLRWRNPAVGVPFEMSIYVAGHYAFYLDGAGLASARPLLSFGEHALALVVSDFDPSSIVLMFSGSTDPSQNSDLSLSRSTDPRLTVLSKPDGTWKYSFLEPQDEAWQQPGFDDSGWMAMVLRRQRRPPETSDRDPEEYRVDRLRKLGATGLGVQGSGQTVWIRKAFSVQRHGSDA